MKKRRTAIIAFLLCACLAIGAGYAAASDSLSVTGKANVTAATSEDFNLDVYFSSATATASAAGDSVTIDQDDPDKATLVVNSLKAKGDSATFKLTITNSGATVNSAAILSSPSFALNEQYRGYFTLAASIDDADLRPGGSTTLTITVTLTQLPNADFTNIDLITVSLNATQAGNI